MQTLVSINGRQVDRSQAHLSVYDNSLLYAEGLFETLLAVDERLMFEKLHAERLLAGAEAIGLRLPCGTRTISRWMREAAASHPARVKKIRLTVTSGESARWSGRQGKPQVIVIAAPHTIPEAPFCLHVSPLRVDQDSTLRRVKTISYVIHAAALKQATALGYDDALMLNEKGRIAEVSSANLFWVTRNRVFTPPLSAGCLKGVTRAVVMKEAAELGYEVSERDITLDKLATADELFLSSSLKLVLGVTEISDRRQRLRFPIGRVTAAIRERFVALAGI